MLEAEVGHGAGDGTDVERIAWGDEDDVEAVSVDGRGACGMDGGVQGNIVEGGRAECDGMV